MRTFLRRLGVLLFVPALVLLGACGDDDDAALQTGDDDSGLPTDAGDGGEGGAAGGSSLYVELLATEVTVDGAPHDLVADSNLRLELESETFGASAGCNSMGGAYRFDGELAAGATFVTGDGVSTTEMGCTGPLGEQEHWYLELLSGSPTATLADDGTWTLTGTTSIGETTVTFAERSVVDPDLPLVDTTWTATGLIEGLGPDGAVSSAPADAPLPSFTLSGASFEGTFDDGCNEFTRSFEVDGDDLVLGAGGDVNDVGCPPLQEPFRTLFLEADRVSIDITANNLTVTGSDGNGMTFSAAA